MKVSCPFCGSENVNKQERIENYPVPFCEDAEIRHSEYYCNDCEEEGDFDGTADEQMIADIKRAGAASAAKLMDDLAAMQITMSYLEKSLRIPFRTTSRWKRGEISQSALALLRVIRFSPQLLQVADENFSVRAQAMYQLSRPCHLLGNWFDNTAETVKTDGEKLTISYHAWGGVKTTPYIDNGTQTRKAIAL